MQRPPIVSEFKRARIKNTRLKWQVLRLGTLALTAGAGIFFVFFEEYNTVDTNGEHCFTGLRRYTRGLVNTYIIGVPPDKVPASQQQRQASAQAAATASSKSPPPAAAPAPASVYKVNTGRCLGLDEEESAEASY